MTIMAYPTTPREKPRIYPFTVTVIRNGREYQIDVRGTHETLHRLCERIDNGMAGDRFAFGPLYYDNYGQPRNGQPTTYDDRDGIYQAGIRVRVLVGAR